MKKMELWSRSQDKRTLIQPNRIDIDDNAIIVWQNNYNCDETYLGTYKTKERALEVLDEIQNLLIGYINDEISQGRVSAILGTTYTKTMFYEMPKE